MRSFEVTRRMFITLAAGLQWVIRGKSQAAETSGQLRRSPIDELNLPAQELEDLEKFASPVLMAARSLDELNLGNLPLDAIAPGFAFIPEKLRCEEASSLSNG